MKRLNVIIEGGVGGPYTLVVEDSDGDLVWWDEAANRIELLETLLRAAWPYVAEKHIPGAIHNEANILHDRIFDALPTKESSK